MRHKLPAWLSVVVYLIHCIGKCIIWQDQNVPNQPWLGDVGYVVPVHALTQHVAQALEYASSHSLWPRDVDHIINRVELEILYAHFEFVGLLQ